MHPSCEGEVRLVRYLRLNLVLNLFLAKLRSREEGQKVRHGVHVSQHDQVLQLNGLFVIQGIEPLIALFQRIRHHLNIHCVNTCV